MKPALILALLGCAIASVALAQQPPPGECRRLPLPAWPRRRPLLAQRESGVVAPRSHGNPRDGAADTQGARETPLDAEPSTCASIAASMSTTNVTSSASSKWPPTARRVVLTLAWSASPTRAKCKWNSRTNSIASRPASNWQTTMRNRPATSSARSRLFRTSLPSAARRWTT